MLMCSKPIRTSGVINGGWTIFTTGFAKMDVRFAHNVFYDSVYLNCKVDKSATVLVCGPDIRPAGGK